VHTPTCPGGVLAKSVRILGRLLLGYLLLSSHFESVSTIFSA
jgi:hypothetical protein